MIQTKNKYCKETFIRLNYWYDRIHGLAREDIEKVNTIVEHFARQSDISIKNPPISPEKCNIALKLSSKKCVIH